MKYGSKSIPWWGGSNDSEPYKLDHLTNTSYALFDSEPANRKFWTPDTERAQGNGRSEKVAVRTAGIYLSVE